MRIVAWIMAALMLASPWAARAEDLSSYAVSYKATAQGAPATMRMQATFKSWTMAGCKKWIRSTTFSLTVQAAQHKVVQRVEIVFEDSLDGPLALASFRATGDAAKNERKIKASFPADGGDARIEIEGNEGGQSRTLPADIVRPRHVSARIVGELRKGSARFAIATVNPAVAGGWARETFELLDRWPFAELPLPPQVTALLAGRSWYVKATRADESPAKSVYLQIHESGIFMRIASDQTGMLIEHTASKLDILPDPGC